MIIRKAGSLKGTLRVPGDKSISHRAVMLGSLARGETYVSGFLKSADCLATIDCFRRMGVSIEEMKTADKAPCLIIRGKGLHGLSAPQSPLDAMNSGTTARILSGILAGQSFSSAIIGDASLSRRPMKRVIEPLSAMGCRIASAKDNGCLPLLIEGGNLHGIRYVSPVASAQVKSCILMAGLYADSPTTVIEPALSRNHTELMLQGFGGFAEAFTDPESNLPACRIQPQPELIGRSIRVPGDISSAACFIAAGLLLPNSEITLTGVGVNKTRDGILRVAKAMGGRIEMSNIRSEGGEMAADLHISSSKLVGTLIEGDLIPTLIDELPAIALMAACAEGKTVIRDAGELRVKESDRLDLICRNLKAMGVTLSESRDGMVIEGRPLSDKPLSGTRIDPSGDHRIAMAFAAAGLLAEGETEILDPDCVRISYPDFFRDLSSLIQ
ncbi:MAG: 3-phosphoshikimate 1-carboxyvinyltransferase [Lachnospiraceae bacterium]|nr:3-phosphoshikimate 1-carboxyvinyltransferase [Lachnospiraceae bacterium]